MKRKTIHQSTHPFDSHPFEVFWCRSWRPVERLRIKNGVVSTDIIHDGEMTEQQIPMSDLRIRSRKSTLTDCTYFLRPGVDVCVFSVYQPSEDDNESTDPVWVDAKITSVERKPHEYECDCQYYVDVYVHQGNVGKIKKSVIKSTQKVQINQMRVLQKLEGKPGENNQYRWSMTEDCTSRFIFKFFSGKFSSDITWLVVASVVKKIIFEVRSINNQIVYHIWDGDEASSSYSRNFLTAINFKLDNDISTPVLVRFTPVEMQEKEESVDEVQDSLLFSVYDLMGVRRSKRRFVQPDRYLGCDDDYPECEVDLSHVGLYRPNKCEYEEVPSVFSIQDDHSYKDESRENYCRKVYKNEVSHSKESCRKSKEVESGVSRQENEGEKEKKSQPSSDWRSLARKGFPDERLMLTSEIRNEKPGDISEIISKYLNRNGGSARSAYRRRNTNFEKEKENRWEWTKFANKRDCKRRRGGSSGKESIFDARSSFKKSVSASVYRELLDRCMKNIEDSINQEQPDVIDQWKEFRNANFMEQKDDNKEVKVDDVIDEMTELDMLWKEMELALASTYLLEEVEGVQDEVQNTKYQGQLCPHDYKLNEQIGLVCRLCGYVSAEIKDVLPSFLPNVSYTTSKEQPKQEDSDHKPDENLGPDLPCFPASSTMSLSEGDENVWALIPDFRDKLRFHQKRAYEFLWRNLAGSLIPSEMEAARRKRGGCVISHTPGAGKTLLIISFLVSYLKLFPGSRPLVLAPKTTLYTWYKEIIKWKIPIPVYQIHGGQTYKEEVLKNKLKLSPGLPRNQDVMHVLDCLEKIQKWLTGPSVLLMGYTSFLTLTREDSNYAHRKYMARVLRQCPGILILDEGHNPRSTKSRLRKGLMKVDTPLRVLLSGTLFQNNFGEYFNTLCLSRPRFINEVLRELDPQFKKKKKGQITKFSIENRARKFFITEISEKIDSDVPKERKHCLKILKKLTSKFIDVYEGGSSDTLPGLQCYTLMMKSTAIQQDLLSKLQNQRPGYKGFPLELELLITLGSIHPWLIKTTACASQYFSKEELEDLEKYKFDLKLGSKVRFVMSLVPRCLLRREKVLIFCHNIAPINLFLEIFDRFYGWRKGQEVLVLQGELELFERGRVMDKFEELDGPSRVMLASINACAEGISLTAASRVILLDSEWNPSKSKQAIARAFRPGQDKMVYVYQMLANGTLEEEKYSRTTWKEWVSSMIFSEEHVEDPSHWQAPKIEDELLREIVEEDRASLFHKILKNEKASNGLVRLSEADKGSSSAHVV